MQWGGLKACQDGRSVRTRKERDRGTFRRDKQQKILTMEGIKTQTELRKQQSQALEKSDRLKKKTEIEERKEEKALVKKKIDESLPTSPPDSFHCSVCTLHQGSMAPRNMVCQDKERHMREWSMERRLLVRRAFQEQARAATAGGNTTRKLGAAGNRFDIYYSSQDLDFNFEEESYYNEHFF